MFHFFPLLYLHQFFMFHLLFLLICHHYQKSSKSQDCKVAFASLNMHPKQKCLPKTILLNQNSKFLYVFIQNVMLCNEHMKMLWRWHLVVPLVFKPLEHLQWCLTCESSFSNGAICQNLDETLPKCGVFELVSKVDLQNVHIMVWLKKTQNNQMTIFHWLIVMIGLNYYT
jgi:hypothetical protein